MSPDDVIIPHEGQPAGKPAMSSAAPVIAPWGFWATWGWGAAAVLVPTAIVSFGWQLWGAGDPALEEVMLMLAAVGAIAVVAVAARTAGWSILRYLGLTVPRAGDVMLGLVSPIIFLAVYFAIAQLTGLWIGKPATSHFSPAFLLSAIILSPLSEELVYRGFLYRGLARSVLGPWVAILLIAAAFAFGHEGGLVKHFCSGTLYGWLRWRTELTTVPIIAHATSNLAVLALELSGVGWRSY